MKRQWQNRRAHWERDWSDLLGVLDTRHEPGAEDLEALQLTCLIRGPGKGRVRARKVVKRSNARSTFKVPCLTMDRMVHCESELERDGILLLDAAPFVTSITEQPAVVRVRGIGVDFKHFPDALVKYGERTVFVEFKEAAEAASREIADRTAMMRAVLAGWGYGYCVLSEDTVRCEPRLGNIKQLLRCGRVNVGLAERERVRRWLSSAERPRTWGDLRRLPQPSGLAAQVCRLVLEERLELPLRLAWNDETPISIS